MTPRRVLVISIVLAVAVLEPHAAAAQCAMCRRALDSPEGRQMIGAFRSGILFLLAAPFATFATVATMAIRMGRRRAATASAFTTIDADTAEPAEMTAALKEASLTAHG